MSGRRGGLVSLVGAGPGDAELLTRKGERRLREADLVLYDALVDPATLALAARAECLLVGRRAGPPGPSQGTVHRLMIRAANLGRRVVRLKGGDPFVFAHGGEDAQALARAGVPFEIVPGVSSSIAAAALAGIPVTHRGVSSAFVVVSGHDPSAYGRVVDSLAPDSATLVVMMGLATAGPLTERLLARGWRRSTPAAVIYGASTAAHHEWMGSLGGLPDAARGGGPAGTIVIGRVVRIGAAIGSSAAPQAPFPRGEASRGGRNHDAA